MKTLEVFKQFVFASILFVTAVSVHLNFTSNHQQKSLAIDSQLQKVKQIQMQKEQLAFNQSGKTAQL